MAKEHLVRIKIDKNDDFIDLYREPEGGQISLCSKDRCANLPDLTGMEFMELFGLLQPLGDKVEFPSDGDRSNPDGGVSNGE